MFILLQTNFVQAQYWEMQESETRENNGLKENPEALADNRLNSKTLKFIFW
jgi:hypothetical protein